MKQKKQLLSILAVTCVCMVCTSCSKDEKLSNRLSGTWRGNWGMSYIDRDGTQYNSDNTVIEFHSDKIFETQGYGYQEDYYQDGPFEKIGLYFNWSIDHQTITINYPGYPEYNCRIRDYVMKKKHFTGYIGNTNSTSTMWRKTTSGMTMRDSTPQPPSLALQQYCFGHGKAQPPYTTMTITAIPTPRRVAPRLPRQKPSRCPTARKCNLLARTAPSAFLTDLQNSNLIQ